MNNQTTLLNLQQGFYTVVYTNGAHRTLRVSEWNGKTVLGFLTGTDNTKDYLNCAFVDERGRVHFWRKFAEKQTPERLQRIVRAFQIVNGDIHKAGQAFGLMSGHCYRCGRLLTHPESILTGIGPECRKLAGLPKLSKEDLPTAFLHTKDNPNRKKIGQVWVD